MTAPLTVQLGDMIRVTTELKQRFTGKLVELDTQNLVIETEPGYERVFRVARCSYDVPWLRPDSKRRRIGAA